MMKNLLTSITTGAALIKKGKFTMKFTKKSQIVKSWVSLINGDIYTLEDAPKLLNLRDVVAEVLAEQKDKEE